MGGYPNIPTSSKSLVTKSMGKAMLWGTYILGNLYIIYMYIIIIIIIMINNNNKNNNNNYYYIYVHIQ
jgi:hypothetical protein